LREARLDKLVEWGILHGGWKLSPRDPTQPPWTDAEHKAWLLRCMEVYAAQVDRMDPGHRPHPAALERHGILDDTLVIFLADNGACAEDIPEGVSIEELVDKLMIARSHTRSGEPVHFGNDPNRMPGPENTYQSYGTAWANLSNTPFRLYKHWIHEGGISTPLIAHWPNGIRDKGGMRHAPGYLPDIMATILDVTGTPYPETLDGRTVDPLEGTSLVPLFERDGLDRPPMFWEHEGNAAVRVGSGSSCASIRDRGSSTTWRPIAPSSTISPRCTRTRACDGGAIRSVGRALRRDSARQHRRADEEPGRHPRVLGEGLVDALLRARTRRTGRTRSASAWDGTCATRGLRAGAGLRVPDGQRRARRQSGRLRGPGAKRARRSVLDRRHRRHQPRVQRVRRRHPLRHGCRATRRVVRLLPASAR
jgi:hypothetical protein